MRLAVPDPRQLTRSLLELPEQLLARVTGLLDGAESVVRRIDALLDRVERTRLDAAAVVLRVDAVAADAEPLVRRVDALLADVEPLVGRLGVLLDQFEPPLRTLQPVVQTLADSTSSQEVEALVTMVDHLPELVRRLEEDLLPIMDTMGSVAPDIHDLLDVSRELNEMLAKLPGMGRIKKRVEAEQEDDD